MTYKELVKNINKHLKTVMLSKKELKAFLKKNNLNDVESYIKPSFDAPIFYSMENKK